MLIMDMIQTHKLVTEKKKSSLLPKYTLSPSCHATSTDFPDSPSLFVSVIHRSRQVF